MSAGAGHATAGHAGAPLAAGIAGIGFWAPRLPGWTIAREVLLGTAQPPEAPAARVAPALLAATERRRAPDTVAIALEVAARACDMAGLAAASMPSVFASTHGDLPINDYMCATLASTPALVSPTKFHNSVHNAAAGYWTIGTGCTAASTALTAWQHTFGNGLLEALVQCLADDTPVLLVAYDVAARGPIAAVTPSVGMLAAALVLTPPGHAVPGRRLGCTLLPGTAAADSDAGSWQALLAGNAMAPCLPLFAALARTNPAALALGVGPGSHLRVDLAAGP
jgi:hypothetical protein